jgi:hypothetical protein
VIESFDDVDDALYNDSMPFSIWQNEDNHGRTKYLLQGSQVISGCSYMPNGDPGYPDDVDVFDISEHDSFRDAIYALFIANAKLEVDYCFENASNEMAYKYEKLEPPHEADFREI